MAERCFICDEQSPKLQAFSDMKKVLLTVFLSAWFPIAGWASEAYEYARDAIDALNEVKEAAGISSQPDPKLGAEEKLAAVMKTCVTQAQDFSSASIRIETYSKSSDSDIRKSATTFASALRLLQAMSEKDATVIEAFLNNPKDVIDAPGTFKRAIFEMEERNKSTWDTYIKVSGASIAFGLTDSNRLIDNHLAYLKITQIERQQLETQLIDNFGILIKKSVNKDTQMNTISAVLLWKFLNGKWKSSDDSL